MPDPIASSLDDDPLARWAEIRARVTRSARDSDRDPADVKLVAVSKTYGAEAIAPLIRAGQRIFGENRVQEAGGKWPALKVTAPDIELHLIGPLQSNKARDAIELFDVIETLDRAKIAEALAAEIQRAGKAPRLYVQVNTGAESQKAGVAPQEADAFITRCRALDLPVEGLMCIPPVDEQASPHFALLAVIAKRNGLGILSMGMSADFELAIQLGATHVRVGSAVFGARPQLAAG